MTLVGWLGNYKTYTEKTHILAIGISNEYPQHMLLWGNKKTVDS